MAFWKWYDRASRVDFATTLAGLIFDWKNWLWAIVPAGGSMTFLWAAYDNLSPLTVWVFAVLVAAALAVVVYVVVNLADRSRLRPSEVLALNRQSPDTRHRYLPGDAQEITSLLRSFRSKLSANVSDSTSLPSFFQHRSDFYRQLARDRLHNPNAVLKTSSQVADEIQAKLDEVKALIECSGSSIPSFKEYAAYRDDLEPLTHGIWYDEVARNLVEEYRSALNVIAQGGERPLSQPDMQMLDRFNDRTYQFLRTFYQKTHNRLQEIDATMVRIREGSS